MRVAKISFLFITVLFTFLFCDKKHVLKIIVISEGLDIREITPETSSFSFFYVEDIENGKNFKYSVIKNTLQNSSGEIFLKTESEIIKLSIIEDIEELLVWISVDNGNYLALNIYHQNDVRIISLKNLLPYLDTFEFQISDMFLFENIVYFDICKGTSRYLVSADLSNHHVNVSFLGNGVDCSVSFLEEKREILFSFVNPLEQVNDINSVFVQSYHIDSGKLGEPVLVHQSGENPSFSPQFVLRDNEMVQLIWEKSYGGVFNSKHLYGSVLRSDGVWSDPGSVYHTELLILEFRLAVNLDSVTILLHEYDFDERKQYLVEFDLMENTRRVLHSFDEKAIAFGKSGGDYFLLLSSD